MAQDVVPAPVRMPLSAGYAFAATSTMLFAMKGILVKLAYGAANGAVAVDAITLLSLRMLFSMPVYALIGIAAWRNHVQSGKPPISLKVLSGSIATGLLGYYMSSYLDFVGLEHLSAQLERLILYTYPMFVMILGAFFFGFRITGKGVLSLLVAYGGIAVIFGGGATAIGEHTLYGAAFVFAAAISYAWYQLTAAPLVRSVGAWLFTCIAMLTACAATLTHFLVLHSPGELLAQNARVYWLSLAIAVFATLLPTFMLNAALGRVNAQAVAIIGTLSPVATIVMAQVMIGEPFMLVDTLGTALVLGGVGLFTLSDARRRAKEGKV